MTPLLLAVLTLVAPCAALAQPAVAPAAARFAQNPLITVESAASLGGHVNGPTVIRVSE